MLLEEQEYEIIWNRIYEELNFRPSIEPHVVPFSFEMDHSIYDISNMSETQIDDMDDLITAAFIHCTVEGELLYALDWQHCGFKFDPRHDEERKSIYVEDSRYMGGGYHAYFPGYYPDGDYYFFIDCKFRFGYLGHPWQEKIWIFGTDLMNEFEHIAGRLGWRKIH